MNLPNKAPPLTFRTRFCFGFGTVAFGVKDNGFSYFLQFFYAQVVGLPSAKVGIAIMAALVIDAFIDPIVGQLSDNWRSKWGRRHPFMYAAALPVALSYLLLWNPPSGWSENALIAYLIGTSMLIRTFITIYEIPSSALAAEMTTDYDERTRLMSYRYLFAWLGGVAMFMLATLVFLRPGGADAGQLKAENYQNYAICAAGLMLFSILFSTIGTHARIPYLAKAPHSRTSARQLISEMFGTLANKTFLFVLGASFFNAMAFGLGLSITLYFVTYFWQFSPNQIATLGLTGVIGAVVAFAVAPRISASMDKRNITIFLIISGMLVSIAPVVLRLMGLLPSNGTPILFWILFGTTLVAFSLSITGQILFSSMIADVVEDSELRTGRRQEGLFFAANAFVNKAVTGAGIFVTSMIVAAAGFSVAGGQSIVSEATNRTLGLIFVPTTAALYLAACGLLLGYRITRRSHQETLRLLAERSVLESRVPVM